jgi:hypothetical protein
LIGRLYGTEEKPGEEIEDLQVLFGGRGKKSVPKDFDFKLSDDED